MSGFARMKRVTDPLDDKAKARIVPDYYVSSSEHNDQADDDVMTSSELLFGFSSPERNDSDSDCDSSMYEDNSSCGSDVNRDLILQIVQNRRDDFRNVLGAHVSKAVQVFSSVNSNDHDDDDDKSVVRWNVMAYLRSCGYNAAVCKAKWQSSGGITAGSYEFIDVLRSDYSIRYLIDLDFASEFEIARRTSTYDRLIQCLPKIFVGTVEDLKQILKVMSDGANRSLKSRGLHLPPWRKHRFMQNKWLGPCRRTVNDFPADAFCSPSPVKQSYGVNCRAVGFNAAVSGGGLLFSATARTR